VRYGDNVRLATRVLLLTGCLAGCSGASVVPEVGGNATRVTGTLTYRERVALPAAAKIMVKLVDVSRADAPAIVLGERTIEAGGRQVPFAFAIPYDAARIEASHVYAVQARIEVDGSLRFITDQSYPVITRGNPTHVDLVLRTTG
jgi:putative lipoprotein